MKNHVVIILISVFLIACSRDDRPLNSDHASHNTNANSTTAASSVDHNAMGHGNAMDHSAMQSSPGAASAPYDLQFIDTMTVHHKGAVDMAMLAETRAQHTELKELATDIIDMQEREMAKMSEWRGRWFGEQSPAVNMEMRGMSHGMGGMDLKKLESLKGNEFDVEFLRQMIPHHEGAVEMANDLQKQDSHAELKELAEDIVKAQELEIKQMRVWLSTWEK
jgi:uncharacterized protein (DUF305 family)